MAEENKQGSGYGLRDKPKPNYKLMHHGDDKYEDECYSHPDKSIISPVKSREDDQYLGAVGGESSDDDFNLLRSDANLSDYDQEMRKSQQELKQLHDEELKLRRAKELHEMKRQIAEKKKTVKKLRGKQSVSKPFVSLASTETVPSSSKRSTLTKPGSYSKSKSSDTDSEDEITVQSLRKDRKLKLLVQKELSKLGLKSNSEDTSSDSSSSDVSGSSDSSDDEYVNISKKKKKTSIRINYL